MTEHITFVAFDMHQDSITAAWLLPGAQTPEVRTIPHEPKAFRQRYLGSKTTCESQGRWPHSQPEGLSAGLIPTGKREQGAAGSADLREQRIRRGAFHARCTGDRS